MVIRVVRDFILKTKHETLTMKKGELYKIYDQALVEELVHKGLVIPEDVFDTYDWCINTCMLLPEHSRLCEKVRPNPCWKYQREEFIQKFLKDNGNGKKS
jgi:hypothetical protein